MKTNKFLVTLLLGTVVACGGGGGGGGDGVQKEEAVAGEATDGVYHAHLRTVNPHANGWIPHGGATFRVEGDQLSVKTYLDDDSSVTHRQSIHAGTRCPSLSDDRNGDGFIDYPEAMAVVGKVLVPLDGDLSGQEKGAEIYPRGSSYTYTKSANISEMLEDLWGPDSAPADEMLKLNRGQGMKLVGRVVLVHGTAATSHLPATLGTRGADTANLSLPIVCGVITPVP